MFNYFFYIFETTFTIFTSFADIASYPFQCEFCMRVGFEYDQRENILYVIFVCLCMCIGTSGNAFSTRISKFLCNLLKPDQKFFKYYMIMVFCDLNTCDFSYYTITKFYTSMYNKFNIFMIHKIQTIITI